MAIGDGLVPDGQAARRLLTYGQAGDYLGGLCPRTVWGLVRSGRLPSVRIGRTVRIDIQDLDALIAAAKAATRQGDGDE